MKRDGDQVLFDSEPQHEEFEGILHTSNGANELVRMLLEEIGRAHRAATTWWDEMREAAQIGSDEYLSYHWPTRIVRIRRRAPGVPVDEKREGE